MKKAVRWLLFIVALIIIITGYGISNYQVIDTITFGFLSKNLSFQIHSFLSLPFVILLFLHIFLAIKSGHKK